MRIKKFRHQLFQPAPSSIANQCDNTPNPILVIKKRIRKIAEINSEFHSSHFRKSSLQHSKSHLKKYQQQVRKCAAWVFWRSCHASPKTEARKVRTHFDTGLTVSSEPPANPKDASTNIISLWGWHLNVTVPAGSYNSGILRKWAARAEGNQNWSGPCQTSHLGVTLQNYSLSLPLQLCPTKRLTLIDSSK